MHSLTEERLGNFPPTVLQSRLSPVGTELQLFFTGLDRPLGLQEAESTRILNIRYMKVVRLSVLRTVHLCPEKISLVLISVTRQVGLLRQGGLCQLKKKQ